jgi:hypothetical protein
VRTPVDPSRGSAPFCLQERQTVRSAGEARLAIDKDIGRALKANAEPRRISWRPTEKPRPLISEKLNSDEISERQSHCRSSFESKPLFDDTSVKQAVKTARE